MAQALHDRVHVAGVADVDQTNYSSIEVSSLDAVNGKLGTFVNSEIIVKNVILVHDVALSFPPFFKLTLP